MSARILSGCAGAALLTLTACLPTQDTGFVEIRMNARADPADAFFLNSTALDGLASKPKTILKQRVAETRLELRRGDETFKLCEPFRLRKNRVATLTISANGRFLQCSVQA